MSIRPGTIFAVAWLAWVASWILAAFWTGRTEKRAATWRAGWDVWAPRLLPLAGAILLYHASRNIQHEARLWHVGHGGALALSAVTCAGLLFTWWARIHLGRLWSGAITRKQDHRVIDSGPYGVVRHPIYAGLIVAIVATAAAQAIPTGLIGAALIVAGLGLKARAEERFLTAELGTEAYGAYRQRVPMLIPRVKWRDSQSRSDQD